MWQVSSHRRARAALIPALLATLFLAAFLTLPKSARAQPAPTDLQTAVDTAQQQLMDLKEKVRTNANTDRKEVIAEMVRIGKELKAVWENSAANDPGRAAAEGTMRSMLNVMRLINEDRPGIGGRKRAEVARLLCRLIAEIDELTGKW
ncbi:MAG: hypothetical protein AB7I30_13785 [Isosphaeraceae bacterium]